MIWNTSFHFKPLDPYQYYGNGAFLRESKLGIILLLLCLAGFLNFGVADASDKLIFGSINKSDSPLYKISEAVLTQAFENLGVRFELQTLPPNRIPVEIDNGKLDGDTHRIYDFNHENKYPHLLRVEEWIHKIDQSVFTKLDNITVKGWKSLSPYRVLYLSGIVLVEKGLELAGIPPENRLQVYDIDNAFNLLSLGRGEVVVVSPSTGQTALKKLGSDHGSIKMLTPPVVTVKLYPYMHKKHAALARKLSVKIREMKKNGQYAQIQREIKE